jgi:Na+-transporting methylmalonyl-CoA/oxaloacetate decarboxylase gamma subunit
MWSFLLAVETNGPTAFQWSNVTDGNGIAIAITGMFIVFVALLLISSTIAALPHILSVIDPYLPVVEHQHQAPSPIESLPADEERVVAAIGMVLLTEMQKAAKE